MVRVNLFSFPRTVRDVAAGLSGLAPGRCRRHQVC